MNKAMGWNSPLWYNFEIAYCVYSDLESLKGYLPDLLNYEKSKRDRNSETSSKQDLWTLPYKINRNCGRRNRRFHSKHILSCHLASARVKSSALTRSTHLHPLFFASHHVLPLYLQKYLNNGRCSIHSIWPKGLCWLRQTINTGGNFRCRPMKQR